MIYLCFVRLITGDSCLLHNFASVEIFVIMFLVCVSVLCFYTFMFCFDVFSVCFENASHIS